MKKTKHSVTARDSAGLAKLLGLKKEDAVAMEFRPTLNKKIVELTIARGLTHAQLAQKTGASRTRITAILNGQTMGVSTDFLLRILSALGCKTTPTFATIRPAA
jgi:DNA-binding Xre family transcriptional regulator